MNRVCLTKDGKFVEMQSGGDDDPGLMEMRLNTLKRNAIATGYKETAIEVKWITDGEWEAVQAELRKESPEQSAESEKETMIKAKIREQAITALKADGKLDQGGNLIKET